MSASRNLGMPIEQRQPPFRSTRCSLCLKSPPAIGDESARAHSPLAKEKPAKRRQSILLCCNFIARSAMRLSIATISSPASFAGGLVPLLEGESFVGGHRSPFVVGPGPGRRPVPSAQAVHSSRRSARPPRRRRVLEGLTMAFHQAPVQNECLSWLRAGLRGSGSRLSTCRGRLSFPKRSVRVSQPLICLLVIFLALIAQLDQRLRGHQPRGPGKSSKACRSCSRFACLSTISDREACKLLSCVCKNRSTGANKPALSAVLLLCRLPPVHDFRPHVPCWSMQQPGWTTTRLGSQGAAVTIRNRVGGSGIGSVRPGRQFAQYAIECCGIMKGRGFGGRGRSPVEATPGRRAIFRCLGRREAERCPA